MKGQIMAGRASNYSEDFRQGLSAYWRQNLVGAGELDQTEGRLRLLNRQPAADHYSNAQLDDYRPAERPSLPWQPPLRLELRARFSHRAEDLRGTAGFGFWNYPLTLFDQRLALPRLPRAIWFFCCTPPGNMQFDLLCPGQSWKAATIDSDRPAALALTPLAPLAVPLMRVPLLYRALWPIAQQAAAIREAPVIADMRDWHTYTIEWGERHSRFLVDDRLILERAPSPRGPMCLVIWIDNQFLELTPQGRFRWGLTANASDQWLDVERLSVDVLTR